MQRIRIFISSVHHGFIEKVGTGTEDIVNLCKERGLKTPEYHQEEDFRVVIWRKVISGLIQIDPTRSKSDPNHYLNSVFVEKVFRLIKENALQSPVGHYRGGRGSAISRLIFK